MKRLISLITIMALMFQLTAFSAFAATAVDKTVFKSVTEVYGVYVLDKNYTDLQVFSAKKLEHMVRDYNTTKFYVDTTPEYKVTSIKYTLSKDKKSVTAKAVYSDKSVGEYFLKKDTTGKVFIQSTDEEGAVSKYPKTYATLDLATKYVKSDKFKATLKLEVLLAKQIKDVLADFKIVRDGFDDTAKISEANFLEGIYVGDSEDETLNIYMVYDFDSETYGNFTNLLDTTLTVGEESYYIYGLGYAVEGDFMSIAEDDDNYMTLTTTDRSTITHITVVIDSETVYDEEVNYQLDTRYTN